MRNHVTAGNLIVPLLLLAAISLGGTGCTPAEAPTTPPIVQLPPTRPAPPEPQSFVLSKSVNWSLPGDVPTGRTPYETGTVTIDGLGEFTFNPAEVQTLRPRVFAPGRFSVFDVVAHLGDKGWFPLRYHYNACLDTHVIDELDGRMNWWYRAYRAGGWPEINAVRMDMVPYSDRMVIRLDTQPEEYMGRLYNSFAQELLRKSINQGRVIIPEVRIGTVVHTNVPVSAHDFRTDVLQPGTVTALDVLLSLADQGKMDGLKLTWYSTTAENDIHDSFAVEQIDDGDGVYDGEATPGSSCWVYETGSLEFAGFKGSHIHVPADVRVIVSPEYMTWYWLELPS